MTSSAVESPASAGMTIYVGGRHGVRVVTIRARTSSRRAATSPPVMCRMGCATWRSRRH